MIINILDIKKVISTVNKDLPEMKKIRFLLTGEVNEQTRSARIDISETLHILLRYEIDRHIFVVKRMDRFHSVNA